MRKELAHGKAKPNRQQPPKIKNRQQTVPPFSCRGGELRQETRDEALTQNEDIDKEKEFLEIQR